MPALGTLSSLLGHYGYIVLFPLAVIEGPIVTIIAGALVSLGFMAFLPAYIVIILGDTVGDALHYAIGRYGGLPLVRKWGRFLGVQTAHLDSLEASFKKHEVKSYLLGKLAHGVGGAVLVVAGLVRASFVRFLGWNVLGTAIKSFALLLLGYYFAHALSRLGSALDLIASAFIIASVASFFMFFWWYGKKHPA
jgi:membrane protein DedA with SNARE-associated domain